MPEGHEGIASWGDPWEDPFACAANVEICSVTRVSPHEGHSTPIDAWELRTSFSNFVPQSSQRYS
jgi:hypothetical protein